MHTEIPLLPAIPSTSQLSSLVRSIPNWRDLDDGALAAAIVDRLHAEGQPCNLLLACREQIAHGLQAGLTEDPYANRNNRRLMARIDVMLSGLRESSS